MKPQRLIAAGIGLLACTPAWAANVYFVTTEVFHPDDSVSAAGFYINEGPKGAVTIREDSVELTTVVIEDPADGWLLIAADITIGDETVRPVLRVYPGSDKSVQMDDLKFKVQASTVEP